MAERLRVGIIGCGEISGLNAWGYLTDDRADIVAVSDTSADRAEKRAAEWDAPKVYGDYRELLEDNSIDIVDILTPHHLHKQIVTYALSAGKHVSVQKPMARNVDECKEMIEGASVAPDSIE